MIERLLEGVRGTVGVDGLPCVERYLRARTDEELERLLDDPGIDDLDRAFTQAIVDCAESPRP